MYLHCGVPLSYKGLRDGDVGFAMNHNNFPALEVLLRKCFTPTVQPMQFIQSKALFTRLLPLLRLLLRLRDILPKEILDPNVLYRCTTALHEAVRCGCAPATNSDPRVARLLVRGFRTFPLFKDANGRTPLDRLTATVAWFRALIFKLKQHTPTGERASRSRRRTKEILRRDCDSAVLMGKSSPASQLYQLQPETLRYIVGQTKRDEDDADDLS